MKRNTEILIGAIAGSLLAGVPAFAVNGFCDYRSVDDGSGSNWNQLSSWECYTGSGWDVCTAVIFNGSKCDDHVPGADPEEENRATILAGDVIFIAGSTQQIEELIIEAHASDPGELQLRSASAASSLTISGALTMQTGGLPGKISFVNGASSANSPELIINASGVTAAGEIVMNATDDAGITVNGTNTFKLTGELVAVAGELTVAGKFENDGAFTMDGTSTVTVDFTQNASQQGGITSDSDGTWLISNSNGTLRVSAASTVNSTDGSITLEDGTIDVDASFLFNGNMDWTNAGIIDVADAKQFVAASGDL